MERKEIEANITNGYCWLIKPSTVVVMNELRTCQPNEDKCPKKLKACAFSQK